MLYRGLMNTIKPNQETRIRNIAIIAHVDHGKTTLVDALFRQSGLFREGQKVEERLMDSMDLERERGITIAAKNCSIQWKDHKINIIDTPGHADFGGEVERGLSMADGAILLVDASEGPLPQTRFVLDKALKLGLSIIVVINKIDRGDARPQVVLDEVYSLLIDLGASEEQLEFPLFYAVGREGTASTSLEKQDENLHCLLDAIIREIPAPGGSAAAPFQMMVSDLGYSDYLGRLAIGRVVNGRVGAKESLLCVNAAGAYLPLKVSKLQVYQGLQIVEAAEVQLGDIAVLAGIADVHIGDTICTSREAPPLPRLSVDTPTVYMEFAPNTSPYSGKEGKFVQSSKLRERLQKESLLNVSMEVEENPGKEGFIVRGRGEFQMAILVETMRREGFEVCVGRPQVIFRKDDQGKTTEPIEELLIECDEQYSSVVMDKLLRRKSLLTAMTPVEGNGGAGRVRMVFSAPSRAMIGFRDEFLTDTRGTGILNSSMKGYEPFRGAFPSRSTGSLVSDRQGTAVPYALYNLEPRGWLFITPGTPVYEGMVIGEHNRENDLNVNPCKEKKLTNVRAAGKDDAVTLTPITPLTLERAIQFLREDEVVEVTPKSIRIRKAVLSAQDRKVREKRVG